MAGSGSWYSLVGRASSRAGSSAASRHRNPQGVPLLGSDLHSAAAFLCCIVRFFPKADQCLILSAFSLLCISVHGSQAAPVIVITNLPAFGSTNDLGGVALNSDPAAHSVAVFINVPDS